MNSKQKWRDLGKLKRAKKGTFFTVGRLLVCTNWSSDWTWADVTPQGDLRHQLIALNKIDRLNEEGEITTIYSVFFFKLTVTVGLIKKQPFSRKTP